MPYTTYQHFLPVDASPELSNNNLLNQEVADSFTEILKKMPFDRSIFGGKVRIFRKSSHIPEKELLTSDGAWQGFNIAYQVVSDDYPKGLTCNLYLGTIGYRGNKPTFADGFSRFIVTSIGSSSTQYGFHKNLRTDAKALMPHFHLKFNAVSLPKVIWPNIYELLQKFNYNIVAAEGKNQNKKFINIGEVCLNSPNCEQQLGNLIECLFAVSLVKGHFRKQGPKFPKLFKDI